MYHVGVFWLTYHRMANSLMLSTLCTMCNDRVSVSPDSETKRLHILQMRFTLNSIKFHGMFHIETHTHKNSAHVRLPFSNCLHWLRPKHSTIFAFSGHNETKAVLENKTAARYSDKSAAFAE